MPSAVESYKVAVVFGGILAAALTGTEKKELYEVAARMALGHAAQQVVLGTTPMDELEHAYAAFSAIAGTSIHRPTAAVAFLRSLGSPTIGQRFSKFATRRHHDCHLAPAFLQELQHTLKHFAPKQLQGVVDSFRTGAFVSDKPAVKQPNANKGTTYAYQRRDGEDDVDTALQDGSTTDGFEAEDSQHTGESVGQVGEGRQGAQAQGKEGMPLPQQCCIFVGKHVEVGRNLSNGSKKDSCRGEPCPSGGGGMRACLAEGPSPSPRGLDGAPAR
mmetsp:Transcript_39565/g.123411  ORF Transcript_39565/g.123411 Transcript_39565/m.123411 type:complete len:273 (+) Transcript_39565:46-864(+)|eukprot:CAMPEP_0204584116 /NCGR_PEP_ID=MMETSP0661-20131031/46157_1 /ASSEMBLY_ACC=CAM_ASM_000606 /TAXON_ID=109239 /ORGANISM="Alexandrium margalefi, Strain AMGDE01CS-322" /LENGTH=272 /DNA_ID=CAMNT_0051593535 /DNA_START=40 /DNA_END=858 /DNA_ORIENTATION=+